MDIKVRKEIFSGPSSIACAISTHSKEANKVGFAGINPSTATSSLYDENLQNTTKQESREIYGKTSPSSDALLA
jgi:hypothetical protein